MPPLYFLIKIMYNYSIIILRERIMANKNQRKPKVRYDRLLGAVILFLLFLIVLTWIFGDKKEKPDQTANETSVSDETTEPPKTVNLRDRKSVV